jgi:catechol 2,3-dioxygenase-like lactoylglutathione lyase family enzyme
VSLLAVSHLVLATGDVPRITRFFAEAFGLDPYFENDMFSEFVLPSKFRVAFFVPVGASAKRFRAEADRDGGSLGVTVTDVEAAYERLVALRERYPLELSGPPKDHPWGETSFLLTDPDGNRWEVTRAPSDHGMLRNR